MLQILLRFSGAEVLKKWLRGRLDRLCKWE